MESYGNRRFGNNGNRDRDNAGGGNFQNRFVPVKVGDEATVTIEAVGEKGDGLAKVKGFVLFVPGGKQGQTVKVRISRVLRKVAFAEIVGEGSAAPARKNDAHKDSDEDESDDDESSRKSQKDDDFEGEEEF